MPPGARAATGAALFDHAPMVELIADDARAILAPRTSAMRAMGELTDSEDLL
jgi:hypothetical protein